MDTFDDINNDNNNADDVPLHVHITLDELKEYHDSNKSSGEYKDFSAAHQGIELQNHLSINKQIKDDNFVNLWNKNVLCFLAVLCYDSLTKTGDMSSQDTYKFMAKAFHQLTKSIVLNTLSFGSKTGSGLGFLECLNKNGDPPVYSFPELFNTYVNNLRNEEMSTKWITSNVKNIDQFEALEANLKNEKIKEMALGYKLLNLAKEAKSDILNILKYDCQHDIPSGYNLKGYYELLRNRYKI